MLVGVGVVMLVSYFTSPRVDAPRTSLLPAPTKPLSKPEPNSLLSEDLMLTAEQRAQISRIASAWDSKKAGLVQAMSGFQPRQGRTDQISADLAGYSQLSRDYDSIRARYWSEALAVLTPSQAKEVGR